MGFFTEYYMIYNDNGKIKDNECIAPLYVFITDLITNDGQYKDIEDGKKGKKQLLNIHITAIPILVIIYEDKDLALTVPEGNTRLKRDSNKYSKLHTKQKRKLNKVLMVFILKL
jgi:hypothetical protein